MSIKIKQEPEIEITREELERYRREWMESNMFTTQPISLETFIRRKKDQS